MLKERASVVFAADVRYTALPNPHQLIYTGMISTSIPSHVCNKSILVCWLSCGKSVVQGPVHSAGASRVGIDTVGRDAAILGIPTAVVAATSAVDHFDEKQKKASPPLKSSIFRQSRNHDLLSSSHEFMRHGFWSFSGHYPPTRARF